MIDEVVPSPASVAGGKSVTLAMTVLTSANALGSAAGGGVRSGLFDDAPLSIGLLHRVRAGLAPSVIAERGSSLNRRVTSEAVR